MNRFLCSCRDIAFRLWLRLKSSNSAEIPGLQLAFDLSPSIEKRVGSASKLPSILDSIIKDGFLWAAPKHRRTVEVRASRRMGFGKMLVPKKNILVCDTCGHYHLAHTVCGNCYEKVKEETKIMQEAIQAGIKLNPIEKDVIVLYEDDARNGKVVNGKRIVELPKKRPSWFSRNLLAVNSGTKKPTTAVGEHFQQPFYKKD